MQGSYAFYEVRLRLRRVCMIHISSCISYSFKTTFPLCSIVGRAPRPKIYTCRPILYTTEYTMYSRYVINTYSYIQQMYFCNTGVWVDRLTFFLFILQKLNENCSKFIQMRIEFSKFEKKTLKKLSKIISVSFKCIK